MKDIDQSGAGPMIWRGPAASLTKRTRRGSISFTTCCNVVSNSAASIGPSIAKYSARLYAGLDGSIDCANQIPSWASERGREQFTSVTASRRSLLINADDHEFQRVSTIRGRRSVLGDEEFHLGRKDFIADVQSTRQARTIGRWGRTIVIRTCLLAHQYLNKPNRKSPWNRTWRRKYPRVAR